MAKKKKKEKRSYVPLTPEAYIRKKSRALPLFECLINPDWKDSGIASIIISRKHTNGNFTLGFYLVDIYCRGIKDTFYGFNISKNEYNTLKDDLLTEQDLEICSYPLVHNIVYGAMEFAEEFGFLPQKDFSKTTINILEEDDDHIELIDIEFGINGKPCLIVNPDENCLNDIARLEKSAGLGNFDVIYIDDEGNEIISDENGNFDYDAEDIDDSMKEAMGEIDDMKNWTEKEWKDLMDGKRRLSDKAYDIIIDLAFYGLFKEDEVDRINEEINNIFDVEISYEPRIVFPDKELSSKVDIADKHSENGKLKYAIKLMQNLIEDYPGNPELYSILSVYHKMAGKERKSEDIIIYSYQKFSDNFFIKLQYALYLIRNDKTNKVAEILNNKWTLKELHPSHQEYKIAEVLLYAIMLLNYNLKIGQVIKADMIYKIILELNVFDEQELQDIYIDLAEAKLMAVNEHMETFPETLQNDFANKHSMKIIR